MKVASGDAWASEVAREMWRKDGKINIPIALFFVSFVLIVGIVLMNGTSLCPSLVRVDLFLSFLLSLHL